MAIKAILRGVIGLASGGFSLPFAGSMLPWIAGGALLTLAAVSAFSFMKGAQYKQLQWDSERAAFLERKQKLIDERDEAIAAADEIRVRADRERDKAHEEATGRFNAAVGNDDSDSVFCVDADVDRVFRQILGDRSPGDEVGEGTDPCKTEVPAVSTPAQ